MQTDRKPLIVGLGGTTRPGSSSERALRIVLDEAERLGAETEMFDGPSLVLPLYAPENPDRSSGATRLVEALRRADGVVLSSPGYHGSVSGLIKNALDYVEDMRGDAAVYLEHRVVGLIVCAAGWQAVGTTLTAGRTIVHALRGWPTPLGVGINTIEQKIYPDEGHGADDKVRAQLHALAGQVMQFASLHVRQEQFPPAAA